MNIADLMKSGPFGNPRILADSIPNQIKGMDIRARIARGRESANSDKIYPGLQHDDYSRRVTMRNLTRVELEVAVD